MILHGKAQNDRYASTIYKLMLYDIFYFIDCCKIQNVYPKQPLPYLELLLLLLSSLLFYYKHTALANE